MFNGNCLCKIYVYIFREVFYETLNDAIDDKICKAGKNMEKLIKTYIQINNDYTIEELYQFMDTYLTIQMNTLKYELVYSMSENDLSQIKI